MFTFYYHNTEPHESRFGNNYLEIKLSDLNQYESQCGHTSWLLCSGEKTFLYKPNRVKNSL